MAKDRFSLLSFYARRANRILPALVLVTASVSVLAWLFLFPAELHEFGKQLLSAATFSSNFLFWHQAGYFDSANKPLLHLWSLAVEEQFYIVWPIVLMAAYRRRWKPAWLVAGIIVLSFAFSIFLLSRGSGSAAFYSPITRAWEILGGGALALFETAHRGKLKVAASNALSFVAVALLVFTGMHVSEATPWPGWLALIPVSATLVLLATPDAWLNRTVLAAKPLVAIGLISYPLYLWHWPFFVFQRLLTGDDSSRVERGIVVLSSFVLAYMTYTLLEKHFRAPRGTTRTAATALSGLVVTAMLSVGIVGGQFVPRPTRIDAEISAATKDFIYLPEGFLHGNTSQIKPSWIQGTRSGTVVFFGDSHAEQYWPRLLELRKNATQPMPSIALYLSEGCPPVPGVERDWVAWRGNFNCSTFYTKAMELMADSTVLNVVVSARWEGYFNGDIKVYRSDDNTKKQLIVGSAETIDAFDSLASDLGRLVKTGKRVFIVLSNPESPKFNPRRVMRRAGFLTEPDSALDMADIVRKQAPMTELLKRVAAKSGAVVIDPVTSMCDSGVCKTTTSRGIPIYRDSDHMTASYSRTNARFIDSTIAIHGR